MRYSLRLLLVLQAIGPPVDALAWRVVPPAIDEWRIRMAKDAVEVVQPDVSVPSLSQPHASCEPVCYGFFGLPLDTISCHRR
jgi:hypothetical protein